jgi:hypothetical protein
MCEYGVGKLSDIKLLENSLWKPEIITRVQTDKTGRHAEVISSFIFVQLFVSQVIRYANLKV